MNEDFENLVKLFDYALSSDNPAIKKALKNLLLIVSIIEPQEEKPKQGPLHDLLRELQDLKMNVAVLRSELSTLKQPTTTYPGTYPSYPNTYPSYPNPYSPGVPWITNGGITSTTSQIISSKSTSSMTTKDLEELVKEKMQYFNWKQEPFEPNDDQQ